jgi:hypothetical protein
MKIYDEINKNPPRTEQIKAGATILVGFGVLGALQFFVRDRVAVAELLWAIGGLAFVISLVPGLGRLLYIGWMGVGITLGLFTQPVVVAVAYVLLFVPVGFVFRAIGRDMMRRKLAEKSASYWETYDESDDAESYFRQY